MSDRAAFLFSRQSVKAIWVGVLLAASNRDLVSSLRQWVNIEAYGTGSPEVGWTLGLVNPGVTNTSLTVVGLRPASPWSQGSCRGGFCFPSQEREQLPAALSTLNLHKGLPCSFSNQSLQGEWKYSGSSLPAQTQMQKRMCLVNATAWKRMNVFLRSSLA